MTLTEYYKFKALCGSGSGGSDSGDSGDETQEVVICDGDVEFNNYGGEVYGGEFTPEAEPQPNVALTIVFNGDTYNLTSFYSNQYGEVRWGNDDTDPTIWVEYEEGYYIVIRDTSLMPSDDVTQTLPIKITQEQSGGDDGDNTFGIATLTINNQYVQPLESSIAYINIADEMIDTMKSVIPGEDTLPIPLYKHGTTVHIHIPDDYSASTSGSCEADQDQEGCFYVTGDATIRIDISPT